MKKLRKLKDGGAIGSGIGSAAAISSGIGKRLPKGLKNQVREGSVRPWVLEQSRRLRQIDLKQHEIRYMDLTERETQLIRQSPRSKENEDFLKSGQKMTADDSNGGIEVKLKNSKPLVTEKMIVGALAGLAISLAILFVF